ncbi:MAG: hypothetical protein H0U03_06620 [Actinobacteria bacterium]|nr:hypothetical protein [Actinomycetota bacterium]
MRANAFSTPRPLPGRLLPAIAASAVVALALPVFLIAGWPLAGWALGAALWAGAQVLTALLSRLGLGAGNLARSGVVGVGMMFRAVAVMVVVIAVAAGNAEVGLAAALVYALAYTLELGISLASYFGTAR